MLFNIAAGLLIFGYSGWALVKYYKKSKQGKCAASATDVNQIFNATTIILGGNGMKTLHSLSNYHHRQVILNYYLQDELIGKDGFQFDTIEIAAQNLTILKDEKPLVSIDTSEYPGISKSGTFPNFFVLENNRNRTELYFP